MLFVNAVMVFGKAEPRKVDILSSRLWMTRS